MSVEGSVAQLVDWIIRNKPDDGYPVAGCSNFDIATLEYITGVRLPKTYRLILQAIGRSDVLDSYFSLAFTFPFCCYVHTKLIHCEPVREAMRAFFSNPSTPPESQHEAPTEGRPEDTTSRGGRG